MTLPRRCLFIGWLLLTAALVLPQRVCGAPTAHDDARHPTDAPGRRAFCVTYHAHIAELPAAAKQVHIWVPLATTRDGQQVLARTVHAPAPYTIAQERDYGNELLHLALTAPVPAAVDVTVDYAVVVRGQRIDQDHPFAALMVEPLARDLRPDALVVIDEHIRAMAREATATRTTDLERAQGIYDYVIAFMRYDKTVPGWGRGDVTRACALAAGNCTDFHSLFIAMARAAGIPARFKIGATVPRDAAGVIPGYHCWAEFYAPGWGWVPVDAAEAWQHPVRRRDYFGMLDPDKFLVSVGRDLTLVPAQQGAPVNMLIHPYVEVDGQPFDRVDTQWRFRNLPAQQEAI